jgi:hypothetical protein
MTAHTPGDGFIEGWHKDFGCYTDPRMAMALNRLDLAEEDIWCVHKWLDEMGAPRIDGGHLSIVGRILRIPGADAIRRADEARRDEQRARDATALSGLKP